jgi:hypothetical protein
MARHLDDTDTAFWDHVRFTLRTYLNGERRVKDGPDDWSQAAMAEALALSPQTLSNFLTGTNLSLGGFAVARACSMGMEFECDEQRIGRVGGEQNGIPQPQSDQQLVLEFTDGFELIRDSAPLVIVLRKGPSRAGSLSAREIRLKIAASGS